MLKNFLVLVALAFMIMLVEVIYAILFFESISLVLGKQTGDLSYIPEIMANHPLLFMTVLMIIHFFLIAYHGFLSQNLPLRQHKEFAISNLDNSSLRERSKYVKSYFNKLSYEVLMRLGFGYYSTLSYIISRAVVTFLMVGYIAYFYTDVFMIGFYIAVPASLATLSFIYIQRKMGAVVSHWNNSIGHCISEVSSHFTITNRVILPKLSLGETRLLRSNAISQSLSNINKPVIELIIAFVLFFLFSKSLVVESLNPIVLALMYRIYGNLTTIVSLFNLYSTSISAKSNINQQAPQLPSYLKHLNDRSMMLVRSACNIDVSKYGGVELRGVSGAGKTLSVELLIDEFRSYNKKVFVWMNSIEFPDMTVGEYISNVLKIKREIIGKEFNDFLEDIQLTTEVSALSLGQKSRLGMYISVVINSDVVVLDEPFANIDVENTSHFINMLQQLAATRKVIITNHSDEIDGFEKIIFK